MLRMGEDARRAGDGHRCWRTSHYPALSRHLPRLRTYSLSYPEMPELDEASEAEATARAFGVKVMGILQGFGIRPTVRGRPGAPSVAAPPGPYVAVVSPRPVPVWPAPEAACATSASPASKPTCGCASAAIRGFITRLQSIREAKAMMAGVHYRRGFGYSIS